MNLRGVDFNMLLPLQALLEERNVSRAAERLQMSQPALSATLRRLRVHFNDALLVRRGNGYELTALASELVGSTHSAALGMERVFLAQADFDPATTSRQFSLVTSDYGVAVLGGPLASVLAEAAPNARLRFHAMSREVVANFPDSLRDYDGAIMPHGFVHSDDRVDLFVDGWVLLVSSHNSLVGESVELAQLSRLQWIFTFGGHSEYTPASKQMELLGVDPHVQIVTPSFLVLPLLLAGTDRVALVQRSLAQRLLPMGDVKIVELPYEAVPLTEAFWWNSLHNRDPAHLWLRARLREAVGRSGLVATI